jgi:glucose/arabinose dehydrogenase
VAPRPHRWSPAIALCVVLSLLLAGCAFGPPNDTDAGGPPNLPTRPPSTSDDTTPPSAVASVIAQGLKVPWALAFLPDGTALATERDTHRIMKIAMPTGADGLTVTPVQTIDEVKSTGEGGLLGIAVSPQYAVDQTVFIYYSTATDNRIAKLKLGGKPEPILTGIPVGSIHDGGRLKFGPDGFLYASTGETGQRGLAQDRASLAGKILRMTMDGKPAPGNPFPDSLVWSYGHRNVQGMAWDAAGTMFATEFGQDTWDEINLIRPGNNYGWPTVEGQGHRDGLADPIQQWGTKDASCSGLAISGRILAAACLQGQRLWMLRVSTSGAVVGAPTAALVGQYGRLRDAVVAPDGSIWVTTSNLDGRGTPHQGDDKILRIVVAGGDPVSKA